ncbi:MAG: hypothetical protein HGA54_01640 [Actinobacteria bacterium]|nr:hypothetical protein [Actinomycetota bacterium]
MTISEMLALSAAEFKALDSSALSMEEYAVAVQIQKAAKGSTAALALLQKTARLEELRRRVI